MATKKTTLRPPTTTTATSTNGRGEGSRPVFQKVKPGEPNYWPELDRLSDIVNEAFKVGYTSAGVGAALKQHQQKDPSVHLVIWGSRGGLRLAYARTARRRSFLGRFFSRLFPWVRN